MSRYYFDADDLIRYGKNDTLVYWEDILNAPSICIDLADDGTLSVEVDDATKVKRVLVEDGYNGDLYYADRPHGEWTNAGMLTVHCSNCKSEFHELEAMNFCPNCGAKMKGADDE